MSAFKKSKAYSPGKTEWRMWVCVSSLLGVIGLVIVVMLGVVRQVDHHYSVQICKRWAVENNRPTKFADYTFMSYDCLTPNPSQPGQWISTNKIIGVR